MSRRLPFSAPFFVQDPDHFGCYLEQDGKPFIASWTGDWAIFDFQNTSAIPEFMLRPLELSIEISSVWEQTKLVSFGTHACIRLDETSPNTVIKIAHPTTRDRYLLHREFDMMRSLSGTGAVAKVDSEPLSDHAGTFGFRLEKLQRVEQGELKRRIPEVKTLVDKIQGYGVCHGDCSPSNVMQNEQGQLVFIDLAFAGRLNSEVPKMIPRHVFPNGFFDGDLDYEKIEAWRNLR